MRRALVVLALLLAGPATASAATKITFGVAPAVPVYNSSAIFSGTVAPASSGRKVDLIANTGGGWTLLGSATTAANGAYAFSLRVTSPGSYAAQTQGATSPAVALTLRPQLRVRVTGLAFPGAPLFLRGRLTPATSGTLALRIGRNTRPLHMGAGGWFRMRLPTRRPGRYRATVLVAPADGFEAVQRSRRVRIGTPYLAIGSSGRAVRALEWRLHSLHYAIRYVNNFYGADTYEAVLAFQKVHRMSRTGRVGDAVWRVLGRAGIPRARIAKGDHVEVDKTRQVLFEVRKGRVARVVHVSTGATGNTPIGRWHVYMKTAGLNSHGMYYSLYWLRGFALHGYASVPSWPASHGCVRMPMWLAPGFYSRWPVGTTVYVYYS